RLCGGGDGTGPPGLRTRLQVPDLASARQVTVHRRHGDRKLLRYLGGRVTAIDGSHDPRPEFHRIRSHRSLHAAAVLRLFIPPLAILLQTALGLSPTLAIVAGACFLGLLVTYRCQTETTGRSLEDIGSAATPSAALAAA